MFRVYPTCTRPERARLESFTKSAAPLRKRRRPWTTFGNINRTSITQPHLQKWPSSTSMKTTAEISSLINYTTSNSKTAQLESTHLAAISNTITRNRNFRRRKFTRHHTWSWAGKPPHTTWINRIWAEASSPSTKKLVWGFPTKLAALSHQKAWITGRAKKSDTLKTPKSYQCQSIMSAFRLIKVDSSLILVAVKSCTTNLRLNGTNLKRYYLRITTFSVPDLPARASKVKGAKPQVLSSQSKSSI